MKNIILLSPNAWDDQEIELRRDEYNFIPFGPDIQRKGPSLLETIRFLFFFDIHQFIEDAAKELKDKKIDAVVGTDEYLACAVAAILAQKLGLPGPSPRAVLLSQHKWHSRVLQKKVFPETTPTFLPVDFDGKIQSKNLAFPRFIKPVRGTASLLAKQVANESELRSHVAIPWIKRFFLKRLLRHYDALLRTYASLEPTSASFVAESVLEGTQVTLEGYVCAGKVHTLGIVDSVMYAGSRIAFERFEYPSRLPENVQSRMRSMADELITRLALSHGMFNIEFFYNVKTDTVHVIEINPRLSFQFTDLFAKVDGFNTYDIQLQLALGETPKVQHGNGQYRVAASFVLRSFEDYKVTRVPTDEELAHLETEFPDARVRVLSSVGKKLSSDFLQDTESYRYGVVNMGADDWESLYSRFSILKSKLRYAFEPNRKWSEIFSIKYLIERFEKNKVRA